MSMADRDGKIWKDGKLIDWRDAKVHVLTHTLHYGMGVFEGVRAYKTPRRHRDLPSEGTHEASAQLGQDFPDGRPVRPWKR